MFCAIDVIIELNCDIAWFRFPSVGGFLSCLLLFSQFSLANREFCSMVRKIFIYTREEVQKMSPGSINAKVEESSAAEGRTTVRDPKCNSTPTTAASEN